MADRADDMPSNGGPKRRRLWSERGVVAERMEQDGAVAYTLGLRGGSAVPVTVDVAKAVMRAESGTVGEHTITVGTVSITVARPGDAELRLPPILARLAALAIVRDNLLVKRRRRARA